MVQVLERDGIAAWQKSPNHNKSSNIRFFYWCWIFLFYFILDLFGILELTHNSINL
jgi:hypothetical protein